VTTHFRLLSALAGLLFSGATLAQTPDQRGDVQGFIQDMVEKHQFNPRSLQQIFAQTEIRQDILDAVVRPYEAKPWFKYQSIFVTDSRIAEGKAYLKQHQTTLKRAEQKYGVPAEIITAILGVESRYGRYKGKFRLMDSLTTLGFDYPPRRKFYRNELEQFLLLSREEKLDPLSLTGSYAGAMGKAQFISSSYRHYAVDFDGDDVRDLLHSDADAIGSIASYLKRHGWQRDEQIVYPASAAQTAAPKTGKAKYRLKPTQTVAQWRAQGVKPLSPLADEMKAAFFSLKTEHGHSHWLGLKNFYAITRYNHSPLYAMAVVQLAQAIKPDASAHK